MRTTLTLDADVAARLKERSRKLKKSFKTTVNETLRQGLLVDARPVSVKPFRVTAHDLGLRRGLSYDNFGDLLDVLEGEAPHPVAKAAESG